MRLVYHPTLAVAAPTYVKGDKLLAVWDDGKWYKASFVKLNPDGKTAVVQWADTNKRQSVTLPNIKPAKAKPGKAAAPAPAKPAEPVKPKFVDDGTIKPGATVYAVYAADKQWYPGKVVSITGDKVQIAWLDGSKPAEVLLKNVRHYDKGLSDYDRAFAGNDASRLLYLKRLWAELNRDKFNGQMKLPNIGWMRSIAVEKFKNRGYWRGGTHRELKINKNVFNNEEQLYETFLHEMCHQYVHEIEKVFNEPDQGHGPVWTATMKRVGLDPLRYDPNENSAYMTDEQKQTREDTRTLQQRVAEVEGDNKVQPGDLRAHLVVKWLDPLRKDWRIGVLSYPENTKGLRWVWTDGDTRQSLLLPVSWMYKADAREQLPFLNGEWIGLIESVIRYMENKKKTEASKRANSRGTLLKARIDMLAAEITTLLKQHWEHRLKPDDMAHVIAEMRDELRYSSQRTSDLTELANIATEHAWTIAERRERMY